MVNQLQNDIIALLQNRKISLNQLKKLAEQRGDAEQLAVIEVQLGDAEALLDKLQGD